MAGMDVFAGNAFSMTSLSGKVEKMDYVPGFLGSLNLFEKVPVRTTTVFVDRRDSSLSLIPTSARGTAPESLGADDRTAVPLQTVRIAKESTLYAHEVQDIRSFNGESELDMVQAEFLRRVARLRQDVELTHEHHRLGALQGMLLDADGSTVIQNYFTEFGVTPPSATSFELDVDTTDVRTVCHQITRGMERAAKGAFTPGTTIHALVGDDFFDALIKHPSVRETYLHHSAASDLREGKAFGTFHFAGITFHNYRGTDDNSTVAVAANEAKLFPVGARDVFKQAMAPAEFAPFINTPGQDAYAINMLDRDRQAWTRAEVYSYPLYICQRPDVLRTATLT